MIQTINMRVKFLFSKETLRILTRNKQLLSNTYQVGENSKNYLQKKSKSTVEKNRSSGNIIKTDDFVEIKEESYSYYLNKSYQTVNAEFLKVSGENMLNNFLISHILEYRALKNKTIYNEYLADFNKQIEFQECALQKIIHICLKDIQQKTSHKTLPTEQLTVLQKRVEKLFRNTSIADNIYLIYISCEKKWENIQKLCLASLNEELQYMTESEQQWLYSTLCQIKNQKGALKVQGLKNKVVENAKKKKMGPKSAINWALLSATYKRNLNDFQVFYLKLLNSGSMHMMRTQQLLGILMCCEIQNTPIRSKSLSFLNHCFSTDCSNLQRMQNLFDIYEEVVPNFDTLERTIHPDLQIKLKMFSLYLNRRIDYQKLKNQQILQNLTTSEAIKYVHYLWNHNLKDHYEIKSLYEGLNFQDHHFETQHQFDGIQLVYYICWIQMGLGYKLHQKLIQNWIKKVSYIPRGLQWPLWNYINSSVNHNSEHSNSILLFEKQNKKNSEIKNILNQKLLNFKNNLKRQSLIKKQLQLLEHFEAVKDFKKFIHSVKLWQFQQFKILEPIGLVTHFLCQQLKVIIYCYSSEQNSEFSPLNLNQFTLTTDLLYNNFSYKTLCINMFDFNKLSLNERINWLKEQIGQLMITKIQEEKKIEGKTFQTEIIQKSAE